MRKKNILYYGDSNTWGAIPGTLKRHPYHVRWTGGLAELLGEAIAKKVRELI